MHQPCTKVNSVMCTTAGWWLLVFLARLQKGSSHSCSRTSPFGPKTIPILLRLGCPRAFRVQYPQRHFPSGCASAPAADGLNGPEARLIRSLLSTYEKDSRPVWNASQSVQVFVSFALVHIEALVRHVPVNEKMDTCAVPKMLASSQEHHCCSNGPDEVSLAGRENSDVQVYRGCSTGMYA